MINTRINVGVVGFGYWGPNLCRNFNANSASNLVAIFDRDEGARQRASENFPQAKIFSDPDDFFKDNTIDAVAIATPVKSHFALARRALESNKHILVEKPLCTNSKDANKLIKLANERGLIGMVDHTFTFSSPVEKLVEYVKDGQLGDLLYFDSVRINLGLFQNDVDVIWDLAPHDLSILYEIQEQNHVSCRSLGVDHYNTGKANTAYVNLIHPNNFIASFHVNWVSPVKMRRIIIGGTRKMLVFDDIESTNKISVFDKSVALENDDQANLLVQYRMGNVEIPFLSNIEPLKAEISYFLNCIKFGKKAEKNSLEKGALVVKALEDITKATSWKVK